MTKDASGSDYIHAVTRGAGWAPGQKQEAVSPEEREFRERMEDRKTHLLATRVDVAHPVTLTEEQIDRARRNIKNVPWAAEWFQEQKELAEYLLAQDADFVERMTPTVSSVTIAGFTCPRCVGKQSGEGFGAFRWDYRSPEFIQCDVCGQPLPDPAFPETGLLVCPRRNQSIALYQTEAERAHPEDRTGRHAWHWVGKPMAMSFSGLVRERKIRFMFQAALAVAQVYRLSHDARYAELAARILLVLAHRFPNWLYHDFYGAFADCDPLYAAAHDRALKLEFKRHPYEMAFGGGSHYETGPVNDTSDQAHMLTSFFGASRVGFPGTHGMAQFLGGVCRAYDLVVNARGPDGRPVWNDAARQEVERNLILEYALESEPWLGGPGQAQNLCNKAPEVYHSLAAVGVCLGIPDYVHVALSGFENLRDRQFLYDGISVESTLYMDAYISDMIEIPELLHGFRWPAHFTKRKGVVDVYGTDSKFRRMVRAVIDQLRADGTWLPLSDTMPGYSNRSHVFEIGVRRYPDISFGLLPQIYERASNWYSGFSYKGWLIRSAAVRNSPSLHALFTQEIEKGQPTASELPEVLFPAWMTAILRHGRGPAATDLALVFNPPGGHRHADNLSLFYSTRGRGVLGDLGYMADTPFLSWYGSCLSHNLVVVDDQAQPSSYDRGDTARRPGLRWMVTSPHVSAVEAESCVYRQCSDYRRTIVLIKGPGADTFMVDLFRVRGGRRHVYRLFSEFAANDVKDSGLDFDGLSMPPDQPLPSYGGSVSQEHVYGLIEKRRDSRPPSAWQATWREPENCYRLHILTPAMAVVESHGPGQERRDLPSEIGRRVRYVDVVREGEDLASTFVAIHEPATVDGSLPILKAEQLNVPPSAGADAVALRIESKWGTYLVFSGFEQPVDVDGVRFQGTLGIICRKSGDHGWSLSAGAGTLTEKGAGFSDAVSWWEGTAASNTETQIVTASPRPAGWPEMEPNLQNYVLVDDGSYRTGFPLHGTGNNMIEVRRFPLQQVRRFRLPAVRHWDVPVNVVMARHSTAK